MSETDTNPEATRPFFEQPQVQVENIPVGEGVPFGIERVSDPELGIGGAYGTWGQGYDNNSLPAFIARLLGRPLGEDEKMDLSPLGFFNRHHTPQLSEQEDIDLEVEVGARLLREAAHACGWKPEEVDAVMIGMSGPVSDDYTEQIAKEAGIPDDALKVSVHKACDSSTGALHLALNPELPENNESRWNLAKELLGKKVLVGGIEGLSRFVTRSRDINALQLFGNGAGVIGVIPGKTMKFLVGKTREVFDEQGLLAVHMYYPRSRQWVQGNRMIEIIQSGAHHIRFAGMMHEPDNDNPVEMAGLMGMVKLFVRNGVAVVGDAYQAYQNLMNELGTPEKSLVTIIVHHANYKINKLKWMQLQKAGINISMPWVLSEFGNVSAASNMIAFLRKLSSFKPGDHILFDGFGAGTYYDAFAIALGGLMP
jgi:3-oxoacyl-[acyl-carrier-protein] synthase III